MLSRFLRRLRFFLRRDRLDDELRDEMALHVELRTRDLLEAGLAPADARQAAIRRFGNATWLREESRAMWGGPLDTWLQDVRYGLRTIGRAPLFSAVIVLSLAFGIGASTAMFSLVDAVLLRQLPVRDPDGLVLLADAPNFGTFTGTQNEDRDVFSYPEFREVRGDAGDLLEGVFASSNAEITAPVRLDGGDDGAGPATSALVSGEFFDVLGVGAARGRTFGPGEDGAPGAAPVAVLSDRFWTRRFGRDPRVLGRTLLVDNVGLVIIGVMPPGFFGERVGAAPDYWAPLSMQAALMPGRDYWNDRRALWLQLVGRLRPGVSLGQVRSELTARFVHRRAALAGADLTPDARRDWLDHRIGVSSAAGGLSDLRGDSSNRLLLLMGLSALLLLLATTNIGGLLLARATARRREIGMRLALGATAGRLVRQLVVESLLFAAMGGGLGTMCARWGATGLLALAAGGGRPVPLDPPLDLRVLAFALGVTSAAGLAFGLVPALQATRVGLVGALRQGAGIPLRAQTWLRRRVVVGQVAVSLVLVTAAGLFAATLGNLRRVDVGYDPNGLFVVSLETIEGGYHGERLAALARTLEERVRTLPGVETVTLSENGLFSDYDSITEVDTVPPTRRANDEDVYGYFDQVAPGYFRAVGIPIVAGREFDTGDRPGAEPVAVVNGTLARELFGNAQPLGRRFRTTGSRPQERVVVGVVGDTIEHNLRSGHRARFYLPYFQPRSDPGSLELEVRAGGDRAALADMLRTAVRETDANLPVSVATVDGLIDRTLDEERAVATLAGLFGVVALLLAALGLYGVVAYSVAQRTGEMGVRMALGARPAGLAALVVRETLGLALAGALAGVPLAMLGGRAIASLLFGLGAADPLTLVEAVALMAAVATVAGLLPARRAARVDPLVALRSE